ncbi:MAG: hypothetical protein HRT45_01030 [Bdellovibrionales bacterium]|nr:hypothetical protein [Bdellovibrionales bacterium]
MRITEELSILETTQGQNRSGTVEGSVLENVAIPQIEGGKYSVHTTILRNVNFPARAKEVVASAKIIERVSFPDQVEGDFLVELMKSAITVDQPARVGGDAALGTVAVHNFWPLAIEDTEPLGHVEGVYEGISELKPVPPVGGKSGSN